MERTPTWLYVFVVYRIEPELAQATELDGLNTHITIKEVLPTEDKANAEVERLNKLNADKGVRYFFQNARYYPTGRTVASTSKA